MPHRWTTDPPAALLASGEAPVAAVCPDTATFRAYAQCVAPTDLVLELGCSFGKCTALLGQRLIDPARQLVGMDTSKEVLAAAEKLYPRLTFLRGDVLNDPLGTLEVVRALYERNAGGGGGGDDGDAGGGSGGGGDGPASVLLAASVTAVAADAAGGAATTDGDEEYAGGGAAAASADTGAGAGARTGAGAVAGGTRGATTGATADATVEGATAVAEAEAEAVLEERAGAVPGLCVFVDIGGNRELEALVALLPWVATALPRVPRFIAVKSETLHAAVRRKRERIERN